MKSWHATTRCLPQAFIFALMISFSFCYVNNITEEPNYAQNDFGICGRVDLPSCVPTNSSQTSTSYKFTNPALANKVLTKLDTFFPLKPRYIGGGRNPKTQYDKPFLGMKNDPNYCHLHRTAFVKNPEITFDQQNIFVEVREETLMKAINEIGVDIMPEVGSRMAKSKKLLTKFKVRPDIGIFFSSHSMHRFKHLNLHFGCLSQEVNHIPGHHILKMKDKVALAANTYAKKFADKPQCFSFDQYFPKTWLLHEKSSCQEFFDILKTEDHQKLLEERKIVFIEKVVNSHRGLGVTPLNAERETNLRALYKDGELCGSIENGLIVQNYVNNALLLEGRKFDFRMYLLVSSTNPLMAFYHDGFLRVSLFEYDANTDDKQVLLTNLALNKDIHEQVKEGDLYQGMDEEALRHHQQWDFERLQAYLLSAGVINDPNWLDNYLRPEFKKAMIHLVRMGAPALLKRSNVYELYGVDFILDTDLKLWFLEANAGPSLSGYSATLEKQIKKMVKDHFEIIFGLLRSRMKRVILLVNQMIEKGDVTETKKTKAVRIKDLTNWRKEFREAVKNRFEPEFEPSPENGFSKILDDNLKGADRYSGLIEQACY